MSWVDLWPLQLATVRRIQRTLTHVRGRMSRRLAIVLNKTTKAKRVKSGQSSSSSAKTVSGETSQVVSGASSIDSVVSLVLGKVLQHLNQSSSNAASVSASSAVESLPRIDVRNPPVLPLGDTESTAVRSRSSQVSINEQVDPMPKVAEQRLSVGLTHRRGGGYDFPRLAQ